MKTFSTTKDIREFLPTGNFLLMWGAILAYDDDAVHELLGTTGRETMEQNCVLALAKLAVMEAKLEVRERSGKDVAQAYEQWVRCWWSLHRCLDGDAKDDYNELEVAAEVATLYLLACDRTGMTHHFDDAPESGEPSTLEALRAVCYQKMDEALKDSQARRMAWQVWGCILPSTMGERE